MFPIEIHIFYLNNYSLLKKTILYIYSRFSPFFNFSVCFFLLHYYTAIQRHQSRKIQQRESVKQEWPQRLQSLENEVRIYREKLRKVRQRDLKFAETRKWQDGQIVGLKKQVKKLQSKLGTFKIEKYENEEKPVTRIVIIIGIGSFLR